MVRMIHIHMYSTGQKKVKVPHRNSTVPRVPRANQERTTVSAVRYGAVRYGSVRVR